MKGVYGGFWEKVFTRKVVDGSSELRKMQFFVNLFSNLLLPNQFPAPIVSHCSLFAFSINTTQPSASSSTREKHKNKLEYPFQTASSHAISLTYPQFHCSQGTSSSYSYSSNISTSSRLRSHSKSSNALDYGHAKSSLQVVQTTGE